MIFYELFIFSIEKFICRIHCISTSLSSIVQSTAYLSTIIWRDVAKRVAKWCQSYAKRSPNDRKVVAKFRQLCELIANVVRVGRQLPANVSPNCRQFSPDVRPRVQIVSPNVSEMSPNGRQTGAKRSPNGRQTVAK